MGAVVDVPHHGFRKCARKRGRRMVRAGRRVPRAHNQNQRLLSDRQATGLPVRFWEASPASRNKECVSHRAGMHPMLIGPVRRSEMLAGIVRVLLTEFFLLWRESLGRILRRGGRMEPVPCEPESRKVLSKPVGVVEGVFSPPGSLKQDPACLR